MPPAADSVTLHSSRPLPVIRYTLFTLVNFAVIFGIWELSRIGGQSLFSEGSVLEWIQFGLLVGITLLLAESARRMPDYRELLLVLAACAALGSIRELDAHFDALIPLLGWKLPFLIVALPVLVFARTRHQSLLRQIRVFAGHRSFALMWCAAMLAMPFAQMVGHGSFLLELFGEDYRRPFKRVIEESAETLAYIWVLLGSIDWILDLRATRRHA